MKEILEAIKDWILFKLEPKVCEHCLLLEDELKYERNEKEYLQRVLFTNARLVTPETTEDTTESDYKPLRPKHVPWSVRRKEKEHQLKIARSKEKVEVNPKLEDAEALFEQELKANASS